MLFKNFKKAIITLLKIHRSKIIFAWTVYIPTFYLLKKQIEGIQKHEISISSMLFEHTESIDFFWCQMWYLTKVIHLFTLSHRRCLFLVRLKMCVCVCAYACVRLNSNGKSQWSESNTLKLKRKHESSVIK